MSKSTNKNSILVLATLGVYFGLVLVGATPQVLANAAMTREFCVTDEIEVKSDLDTKPDNAETVNAGEQRGIDHKVARSVERFLAQFRTAAVAPSLLPPAAVTGEQNLWQASVATPTPPTDPELNTSVRTILSPACLARASLDAHSAVTA